MSEAVFEKEASLGEWNRFNRTVHRDMEERGGVSWIYPVGQDLNKFRHCGRTFARQDALARHVRIHRQLCVKNPDSPLSHLDEIPSNGTEESENVTH